MLPFSLIATVLSSILVWQCYDVSASGAPDPVNGAWGSWGQYSECAASCGGAPRVRTRKCDKPKPEHGGKWCQAKQDQLSLREMEQKSCGPAHCPVNGSWGSWGVVHPCNATCGESYKVFERKCNNPQPDFGGNGCDGTAIKRESCNLEDCQVPGLYKDSPCSVTCGKGMTTRQKPCRDNEADCVNGMKTEEIACYKEPCYGKAEWSEWTAQGSCSATCGEGKKTYIRRCRISGIVKNDCEGEHFQIQTCNEQECSVDDYASGIDGDPNALSKGIASLPLDSCKWTLMLIAAQVLAQFASMTEATC